MQSGERPGEDEEGSAYLCFAFDDFLATLFAVQNRDAIEEVTEAFRVLDTTDSGRISLDDLVRLDFGERMMETELEEMRSEAIESGCVDAEMMINYRRFVLEVVIMEY